MKKNKTKAIALLLLAFSIATAEAQQGTTSAGGYSSGSGGTVVYSLGQIVYTTHIGTTGSEAQGIQQSYEISTTTGLENNEISLAIQAYPNPTADFLQLNIEGENFQDLAFQLFDLAGNLIESRKIASTTEIIQMKNLATATYFLKVIKNDNKEIVMFKIIKN